MSKFNGYHLYTNGVLTFQVGIFILYFMDYCIGSGWWIMVLYLLELVAVFVVRGAPYCGENIVTVFMTGNGKFTKCFAPLISFIWNVILPVTMLVSADVQAHLLTCLLIPCPPPDWSVVWCSSLNSHF